MVFDPRNPFVPGALDGAALRAIAEQATQHQNQSVGTGDYFQSPSGTVYAAGTADDSGNSGSGGGGNDVNFFRQCGQPASNRWYTADTGRSGTWAAQTITGNKIWLLPFVTPDDGLIDGLQINLQAISASFNYRLGIYARVDAGSGGVGNNFPGELVYTGALRTGASPNLLMEVPNYEVEAGEMYWLAAWFSRDLSLISFSATDLFPIMGMDSSLTQPCAALSVAHTSTTLPSTLDGVLDSSSLYCTGNLPVIGVHFNCSSGSGTVVASCCPVAPAQWGLSVGNLNNQLCLLCDDYEADFTLTYNNSGILAGAWSAPFRSGGIGCPQAPFTGVAWLLTCDSSFVRLFSNAASNVGGVIARSLFNCNGPNVFTLGAFTSPNSCQVPFGTTATIVPI